jgi:valyl-tRNA synthetase
MKVGRRLAIKLLNASRFVLSRSAPMGAVTEAVDRGMLMRLQTVIESVTRHLQAYDYAAALREIEEFFWWFCDDYIELVKRRRAGDDADAASAVTASNAALSVLLRLFAPFLPFVTEEVWSWSQQGSVHRASWPTGGDLPDAGADTSVVDAVNAASAITTAIRQARSSQKLGFGVPVRVALAMTASDEIWRVIEADVLTGNNVAAAVVTCGAAELVVEIAPAAADA